MTVLVFLMAVAGDSAAWKVDLSERDLYTRTMMTVSDQGAVALMDSTEGRVVFFDANGRFMRRTGAKGKGPGEIAQPIGMGWRAETKQFWVLDGGNGKLLTFDSNGAFVSEIKTARDLYMPTALPGNRFLFQENGLGMSPEQPAVKILALDSDEVDLVWSYGAKPLTYLYRGNYGTMVMPYTPRIKAAAGKDFVALNYADDQIRFLDFNSKVLAVVPADLPRQPLDRASIEEALSSYPVEYRPKFKPGDERPDYWYPVDIMLSDALSRIWIFSRSIKGKVTYRILDRDGKEQGKGTVERAPRYIGDGWCIRFVTDEEDTVYLERAPFP
ncbi:MAG: 6-bladed beta-propeller [Acidobacteriota bacterium]|nr:6-bladed beta-propeller [Acidobacteriota bacterium]